VAGYTRDRQARTEEFRVPEVGASKRGSTRRRLPGAVADRNHCGVRFSSVDSTPNSIAFSVLWHKNIVRTKAGPLWRLLGRGRGEGSDCQANAEHGDAVPRRFLWNSEACRNWFLGKGAVGILPSFPAKLGRLLVSDCPVMRRCCSSPKGSPSLRQSPSYTHVPFRTVRPQTPSFSSLSSLYSLSLMSPERQSTTTSQASAKVSSLARRIHGWSWQAVRFP